MKGYIDINGQEVAFLSNGATPVYYRMIFKEDFLTIFQKIELGEVSETEAVDTLTRLAYVMFLQAKASEGDKESRSTLKSGGTEGAFIKWLEGFEALDFPLAVADIFALYQGESLTIEEPKKE